MSTRWDAVLRQHGYRITPQREHVLRAVNTLQHATPDEIYAQVKKATAGVTLSTVYRALDVLEEVGLVTHTHFGHGAQTYHAVDLDDIHLHLVCSACDAVVSLPEAKAQQFVDEIRDITGFICDIPHSALHGLCPECVKAGVSRHGRAGSAPSDDDSARIRAEIAALAPGTRRRSP